MDAFEIVRLAGLCIALVLGAIVFLVVFFRGMSWLDRWIKKRNESDQRSPRRRNGNRPRRPKSSDWDSLIRQRPSDSPRDQLLGNHPISQVRNQPSEQLVQERLANRRARAQGLAFNGSKSEPVAIADTIPANTVQTDVRPQVAASAELESVTKPINRIATVHLLSGETIERVAFSSKEKANKICDGLGFEGVVFENDDGQIFVVRENNIKMVTWKAG